MTYQTERESSITREEVLIIGTITQRGGNRPCVINASGYNTLGTSMSGLYYSFDNPEELQLYVGKPYTFQVSSRFYRGEEQKYINIKKKKPYAPTTPHTPTPPPIEIEKVNKEPEITQRQSYKGTDRRAMCMSYAKDIVVAMIESGMLTTENSHATTQLLIDIFEDILSAVEEGVGIAANSTLIKNHISINESNIKDASGGVPF